MSGLTNKQRILMLALMVVAILACGGVSVALALIEPSICGGLIAAALVIGFLLLIL
jgi:hypothetical protein